MCCVPTFLFFYLFVECHNLLCCCLLMGNYLLCCAEIIFIFICLLRGNLIYCAEFLFTSVCVLADFLVCLFWVADLIFAILGLFMLSFPGI
jgi:hypothetical protein